jgi:hypothetical protein
MKRIPVVLFLLVFAISLTAQNRPYPPPPPPGGQADPWVYGPQNNNWDRSWNNRPFPRSGACFFTSRDFSGNRFCVRSGDRLPQLPGNFGDNISSIQTFGRAQVTIFNDRNFRGGNQGVPGSIPDLRQLRFRGGHTWNNRVSSIVVN